MNSEKTAESRAGNKPQSFGHLVRFYRRQSRDPMRGGLLTQERLGELIGEQMGDAGYSGAAVSEWEREKSKIHADDRLVLLALLKVLILCGGLKSSGQADELLAAGNYRRLNEVERAGVFPDQENSVDDAKLTEEAAGEPAAAAPPARRSKQLILLEKVSDFWVEGVLVKSVQGAPLIEIPHTYSLDHVDHPWGDSLGQGLIVDMASLSPQSIYRTYKQTDGALLLLGQPGSGKTTALISLAREMIERARADWQEPIPVILDLSGWAGSAQAFSDWVVEEIAAKYQIPRRYGREWLAADELALLLDGLDTLPPAARRACIEAINEFRLRQGLTGVVVCCRSAEYQDAEKLLSFNGAITLQPLGEEQILTYLVQGEQTLEGLEAAWAKSPELREMAQNPLMLNMMTAVFANGNQSAGGTTDVSHDVMTVEMLFDAYVQRMFEQHVAHEQYTQDLTETWLAWLAGEMDAHNQSIFLIEQIQPSWLPNLRWRRLYLILAGLITGFAGGLIMWLLWRLLRYTLPQLPAPTSATISSMLGTTMGVSEPLAILLGNLVLGLLLGITLIVLFERRKGQHADAQLARHYKRQQMLLVGLETGVVSVLFMLFFSEPLLAVAWGVAEGFMFGSAARYIFGWNYATEVRTVEALGWSWRHALTGALIGLVMAVVAEVIESLLFGFNGASRTLATLIFAGFVLGGLRGRSTEKKSRPNQGVWLSLRNALVSAVVLSAAMAVLALIIRDEVYAWQIAVLAAVVAASMMGASVFVKHFILRSILRYTETVPWRYSRFLDYASQLVLLRKVGNGYIFMHGLMQNYFANHV